MKILLIVRECIDERGKEYTELVDNKAYYYHFDANKALTAVKARQDGKDYYYARIMEMECDV